jgi:hypothetical protein
MAEPHEISPLGPTEPGKAKASATRREATRLRATFNSAVVLLNLLWEGAWGKEGFVAGHLDAALLADCRRTVIRLHIRLGDGVVSKDGLALRAAMKPSARLLEVAVREIQGLGTGTGPGFEVIGWSDKVIKSVVRESPTNQINFAQACIHARRYVLLAAPGRLEQWSAPDRQPTAHEFATRARVDSLRELESALRAGPGMRNWARRDPTFSQLLDERDFEWATLPPGEAVRLNFREPWTTLAETSETDSDVEPTAFGFSDTAEVRPNVAIELGKQAERLRDERQPDQALRAWEQQIREYRNLMAHGQPTNAYALGIVNALLQRGVVQTDQEQHDAALTSDREAVSWASWLHRTSGGSFLDLLTRAILNTAFDLRQLRRYDEAAAWEAEARRLSSPPPDR